MKPPPAVVPVVISKQKSVYIFWTAIHKNFPRVERFGIGNKIEQSFLDLLGLTFQSAYLPPDRKITILSKAISELDFIKFFSQLAWEAKFIPTEKYSELSIKLEEIGRMLGGWKIGLEKKLSAHHGEKQ